jgi:hypothetical protein
VYDIEEKANDLDYAVAKLAAELSGKIEVFERERKEALDLMDARSDALRDECNELFKRNLTVATDSNEMRRQAWRWYAGQLISRDSLTLSEACVFADSMLAEEESRFGKIGGCE